MRTVRVYVAGISNYCLESVVDNTKSCRVVCAIKGCARLLPPKLDTRSPVDLEIMKAIKLRLSSFRDPAYDQHLIWTSCVFAFAGFLRVFEFTASELFSKPDSSLLLRDVSYDGRVVKVFLEKSKTDHRGKGFLLRLEATRRTVCPVRAFQNYYKLRSLISLDANLPFFIYSDGSFLSFSRFSYSLKILLPDHPRIQTHSFRIGAATSATLRQNSEQEIMRDGRWK